MEFVYWQMIIAIFALSPFAFIGVYWIFIRILNFILIRRGRVKLGFFTGNRGFKTSYGKPQSDHIVVGKNKLYKFNPRKLFRWGHTPMALYNEDSIEQLDPLVEEKSKLSTTRLSELLIRWFNLGVISSMKKEKILTMLLIALIAVNAILAGVNFISWQSINSMAGTINEANTAIGNLPEKIVERLPNTTQTQAQPPQEGTTIPVLP